MFGSDGSPIIQYLVIFAIIFSALAAIVLVVRRLTGSGGALPGRSGRARQPRLGIVDVYELDRARQLILLRRDNVEHLLLVGGPNDVVVERNIQRGQRPLSEPALRAEPAAEPLPDPLAEAGRLPEPPRALAEPGRSLGEPAFGRPERTFEMPVVVPPPVPGSSAAPPVRLPLDAALIDGDEPGRDIPVPPLSPAPQPEPSAVLPASVREALTRPRTLRTSSPVLDRKPMAEKADETVKLPSAGMVLPPLTSPPVDARPVDPVVLSDMARQLQAAISRPSSAAAPPPAPPTPAPAAPVPEPPPAPKPEPQPPAPAAPPPIDPIAAAMAALMPPPIDPIAAGMSAATDEPEPVASAEPPRPARTEKKAVAKAEPKSPGNPFSVEEIEAEFARLLGRPLDKRN
ncbi:hypothetical protein [Methylobacterium sp. NFXW15]|uniref:hypothetical protein n=1 Tax=Methylobacterium sp. NFXW15 TaxID=2819512 RepID=UPI003CEC31C1